MHDHYTPEQPEGVTPPRAIELPRPVALAMVGGFLGAGKTTAIGALASELSSRGLRVALVTNDQAAGLVDTAVGMPDVRLVRTADRAAPGGDNA